MLIKISTNPTMKIDFTEKEINNLTYAYRVLENVEKMIINEGINDGFITNQKTGAWIDLTELQKVRWILGGIIGNVGEKWDLKSKSDIPPISF